MNKEKIQIFEKELRKHVKFNKSLYNTFLDLNFEFDELKDFTNKEYFKVESLDSMFGEDSQRNDDYYVEDVFKDTFKGPSNLRNRILKFMKQQKIDTLPYEKVEISLYCDGKVNINGEYMDTYSAISFLRNLKRDKIACNVSFVAPSDMDLFKVLSIDFKKYYFKKKLPIKMKNEEVDEYIALIEKAKVTDLDDLESKRYDELKKLEHDEKFSKTQYIYKIDDDEPIIIDRLWTFSELEKMITALRWSLPADIREITTSTQTYRNGKYKVQDRFDGMTAFFDKLQDFADMKISDEVREIREAIEIDMEPDMDKVDEIVKKISKFTLAIKDLYFLNMDKYFEEKKYKFKE